MPASSAYGALPRVGERRSGRFDKQKEDGDCLFHAWGAGRRLLGLASLVASACRAATVGWMRRRRGYRRYPTDEPLETWVQYDEWARAGERYDQYCVRMAKQGEFGGGPEIIGLTQQDKISACVWRAVGRGRGQKHLFEMTSSFEVDGVQRRINLCRRDRPGRPPHYDHLLLDGSNEEIVELAAIGGLPAALPPAAHAGSAASQHVRWA